MAIDLSNEEAPTGYMTGRVPNRLQAKENLFSSYLRIFRDFRRHDLNEFCDRHAVLYSQALASRDHIPVTQHYYSVMTDVIETYYGDGWHFCPPQFKGQGRADATVGMYNKVAELLQVKSGDRALDIGCGVGGMLRHVALHSGANLTGITLGENEVLQANRLIADEGLGDKCQVVQGDCQSMQFERGSFDGAYAVYALKYYPDLSRVMSEIYRVLRPGGRLVAYCLCKSNEFDPDRPQHQQLLKDFQYSTAMPSMHSVQSICEAAEGSGLRCVSQDDLSSGQLTWYSYWVRNPLLPWVVSSKLTLGLVRSAEAIGILPKGFTRFNDTFLSGTLRHIIRAGKTGVLTGSALLTFEKADD